ncbi:MAG TPA: folylpolyglutamate synthase/dihydrofolate synthase family protein [Acidimicrobiia bacterium]|jgi:dihydrofolate synthase/folylpolyglutamate synthase
MDYSAAVDYLDNHIGMGVKPGLERISGLLALMGNPEESYPMIHVAGTNGKTSTCRMATVLCLAHGLSTGTFISPHLERVEERFSLDGRYSSQEQFAQAVSDVAAFTEMFEDRDSLTYFELTAATAYSWFADQAVDVAVVEVGLGGRLDATNAARGEVTVVTGIDLDHTEMLGNTLAAIAREKLGIVKEGSILVTGPLPPDAAAEAEGVVRALDVEHYAFGRDFSVEVELGVGGWLCRINGIHDTYEDVFLPVHGRHQTVNLAVAAAAVEALLGRSLDPEAVVDGASVISCPGRLEVVSSGPLTLLDGAHNPQGFRTLASSIQEEFPAGRWVLVTAAMKDKDLEGMFTPLRGRIDSFVATTVDSPRAVPASELAAALAGHLEVEGDWVPTPAAALDLATAMAGDDGSILVAGSLYLVGAVRSLVLGDGTVDRNER